MFDYDQDVYSNRNDKAPHDLSPVLLKSINKIIQNEGYITYSIYVNDVSTEGGNYLSLLKVVDIKGETVNDNKETNLFIKQSLPDSNKNILSPKTMFSNEIFVYTKLAELFNELQNKFNVPGDERYNFVKCYNSDDTFTDDSIILDNMIRKGFKICNRFDVPSLKLLELTVKELAKFHGLSTVLKRYNPEFYKNKIQHFKHLFVENNNNETFTISLCNIALEYLEDDERKAKLEKYLPGLPNKLFSYIHKNEGKANCLCHGDYRMNNILVKEMNGEAANVIPIDYQGYFHGSPVTDLIYLIFMSTDRQFRKKYMEHLKLKYFEYFTQYLQYFKIDAESVYSQKDFENDFKKQLDFGLIMSLTILPFVLASDEIIPELNSELKTIKVHASFKARLEEIVDDFIEWGYL